MGPVRSCAARGTYAVVKARYLFLLLVLLAAAEADFVVCLYNPASRTRRDYLQRACALLLRFREPETVCGVVKNIGRAGQASQVCSLSRLGELEVDMFTTVFVGNSQTQELDGHMVTPRGYRL